MRNKTTVAEMIKMLKGYNPEAEFSANIGRYPEPVSLSYGSSDGCTKKTADIGWINVGKTALHEGSS